MKWPRRKPRHVHDWTKWQLVDGQASYPWGRPRDISVQTRQCSSCGWTQLREVGQ